MKLFALEATFIGRYNHDDRSHYHLPSVEGAQGLLFICPKCQNHSVICWFANPRNAPTVPDDAFPGPGRWTLAGDTIDTLSLHPSVDLSKINDKHPAHPGRCYWHGWVANGEAN